MAGKDHNNTKYANSTQIIQTEKRVFFESRKNSFQHATVLSEPVVEIVFEHDAI